MLKKNDVQFNLKTVKKSAYCGCFSKKITGFVFTSGSFSLSLRKD
jgi:hypothetical protein